MNKTMERKNYKRLHLPPQKDAAAGEARRYVSKAQCPSCAHWRYHVQLLKQQWSASNCYL